VGDTLENAQQVIGILIETGNGFTYANFSTKSEYGYPNALRPEWTAWRTRVNGAIKALFGESSAPYQMVQAAEEAVILGNGEDKFANALAHYLGALEVARTTLADDTFGELVKRETAMAMQDLTNKVFVVHGRDNAAKDELSALLTEMGLEPIVLHRQADEGRTIIEKFEAHADVGFAFILLTPDEVSYLADEDKKADAHRVKEFRARPNVIFEFGYFVGRLGRSRTCCLYRGNVTLPSDLDGLVYKRFDKSIEEAAWGIQRELKAAGYQLP